MRIHLTMRRQRKRLTPNHNAFCLLRSLLVMDYSANIVNEILIQTPEKLALELSASSTCPYLYCSFNSLNISKICIHFPKPSYSVEGRTSHLV